MVPALSECHVASGARDRRISAALWDLSTGIGDGHPLGGRADEPERLLVVVEPDRQAHQTETGLRCAVVVVVGVVVQSMPAPGEDTRPASALPALKLTGVTCTM